MNPDRAKQVGKRAPWPKGRRRNASVRVRGYATIPHMLRAVDEAARAEFGGLAELARHLGVHHSTLAAWLSGRKWPSQERADQLVTWLRGRQ